MGCAEAMISKVEIDRWKRWASRAVRVIARCALAILVISTAAASAQAQSHLKELQTAEERMNGRQYTDAISKVTPLLENLVLTTLEEIILAHRILGVSHCELGDEGKARVHFDNLITLSPSESPPKQIVTEPCRILFLRSQKGNAAYQRWVEEQGVAASFVARPGFKEGKGLRYIPYGVGQFANDKSPKGAVFLTTEAFFTAAAVTTLTLFESEEKNAGKFLHPDRAEALRVSFLVSTGATIGFAIWGLLDALNDYKDYTKARASARMQFEGTRVTLRF